MSTITLVIIPGPGARTVEVTPNMTIETLISTQNLQGREIIVDGVGVQSSEYSSTLLQANSEVFATGSVKGN